MGASELRCAHLPRRFVPSKDSPKSINMTITLGKKATTTTLSGSVQTVVEYLEYSVHSLLYQRGLYPSDDFQIVKKYNLSLLLSNDDKVKEYIATIMKQLHRMFFLRVYLHWRAVSLSAYNLLQVVLLISLHVCKTI